MKNNIKTIIILLAALTVLPDAKSQTPSFSGTFINMQGKAEDANMSISAPATDLETMKNLKNILTEDAKVSRVKKEGPNALNVSLGHTSATSSVYIPFSKDVRLDDWVSVALDITNNGPEQIYIEGQCYSDNDNSLTLAEGAYFYSRSMLVLDPGETDTMVIYLSRDMNSMPAYMYDYFQGMFGIPGGFLRRKVNLDLSHYSHIRLFKQYPGKDWNITVRDIRTYGKYSLPSKELLDNGFFPFIDKFGQYKYSDWDGKVKSAADMHAQREAETADNAANPVSPDWDQYGGWAAGPQLEATGHFRVEKYNGKWWFVDPEGRLFWSQGLCEVRFSQTTKISGRENYYSYVPFNGDFYMSNLITKYQGSPDFASDVKDNLFDRLQSWGFNTVALSSVNAFTDLGHKVPYAITLQSGIRGRIPDEFDAEAFKQAFRATLSSPSNKVFASAADDPWCLGFFVDNECGWPSAGHEENIYAYFKAIREVFDELCPHKLYLGCRSNSPNFNRTAFEAEAKYSDVISINHYDYNLSTFDWTKGLDKPMVVGEYHFGSLDKGQPHTGLRTASSQKQRARIYKHFVDEALESDYIIGTHWFQYIDQCYTARMDGENYQIGFIDICDRPHKEMIEASRQIKGYMYHLRSGE